MPFILLALFIGVPIMEIALFIQVGGFLGLWPTLGIILATAILGALLLKIQGLGIVRRAEQHLQQGELPVAEVVSGVFLLVAGALLLTPGFVTDAIGFALFVPAVRLALGRAIMRGLMARGTFHAYTYRSSSGPGRNDGPRTIDGDYRQID